MLEVSEVKHENDGFDDSELDKYFDHSIEQYYAYEQVRRRFKIRIVRVTSHWDFAK